MTEPKKVKALTPQVGYKLVDHAKNTDTVIRPVLSVPHYIKETNTVVAADGFRIAFAKILEIGEYPNWEKLIPKEHKVVVEVSTNELAMVVQPFVSLGKLVEGYIVRIVFEKNKMRLYTEYECFPNFSVTLGYKVIDGDTKGVKIALNPKYLLACAKSLKVAADECTIEINKPSDPVLFVAGNYSELIMPMYVQWDKNKLKGTNG